MPKTAYGKIIDTTVGRVIFNMVLPKGMPFYNIAAPLVAAGPRHQRLLPVPRSQQDDLACSTT